MTSDKYLTTLGERYRKACEPLTDDDVRKLKINTKAKSLKLLQDAGIVTKSGKLRSKYSSKYK